MEHEPRQCLTATTPHLQAASDRLCLRLRLTGSRPASCDTFGTSKVLLQRHQTLDAACDSAARACCTVHPLRQLTYTKLVTETVAEMAAVVVQLRTTRHTAVNRVEARTRVVSDKIKHAGRQAGRQVGRQAVALTMS